MMARESNALRLLLALLCLAPVECARLAFALHDAGAYCKSSTYDVKLEKLKFSCTSGENLCRAGDKVVVEGHCK